MLPRLFIIVFCLFAAVGCRSVERPEPASVIFLHPDGAGLSPWEAYRYLAVGPDGSTNYDKLPHVALYRGHMKDSLTGTSNGGATSHALGVKVAASSFGNDAGEDVPGVRSFLLEAREAGVPIGLVNSGTLTEPGTACFVTDVKSREDHAEIARQLVASGADVMLGGGERYFLPEGVAGRHGSGTRKDGRNLVEEARAAGYTVVFTAEELSRVPAGTTKLLGLFAALHTFNDKSEEALRRENLPRYNATAPTLAEMTLAALKILSRGGRQFALVVEEEGSDNFGNAGNAGAMLEAIGRTDETIAAIAGFIARNPRTLMMTTCDSDAGGMRAVGLTPREFAQWPVLPANAESGAPLDGVDGTGSAPFMAAPDRTGRRLPFAVTWTTYDDVSGGIAVKAVGYRAELVKGQMDNTEIPKVLRRVLRGER